MWNISNGINNLEPNLSFQTAEKESLFSLKFKGRKSILLLLIMSRGICEFNFRKQGNSEIGFRLIGAHCLDAETEIGKTGKALSRSLYEKQSRIITYAFVPSLHSSSFVVTSVTELCVNR